MKRPPMTLTEHQHLGRELKNIETGLWDALEKLQHHYGQRSKAARLVYRVKRQMSLLRCELDDQVFRDCPLPPGVDAEEFRLERIGCYYGRRP